LLNKLYKDINWRYSTCISFDIF